MRHDPRQAAQTGEAQQGRDPEEPEGRDRADEVQPAAPPDEVRPASGRPSQVQGEVDEEDDADGVVVDQQRPRSAWYQRHSSRTIMIRAHDGQDQHEDVVGVAPARPSCEGDSASGPRGRRRRRSGSWGLLAGSRLGPAGRAGRGNDDARSIRSLPSAGRGSMRPAYDITPGSWRRPVR